MRANDVDVFPSLNDLRRFGKLDHLKFCAAQCIHLSAGIRHRSPIQWSHAIVICNDLVISQVPALLFCPNNPALTRAAEKLTQEPDARRGYLSPRLLTKRLPTSKMFGTTMPAAKAS